MVWFTSAALKSVGESVQKPLLYHQNNIESLLVLLEVMKQFNVRDFIFIVMHGLRSTGSHSGKWKCSVQACPESPTYGQPNKSVNASWRILFVDGFRIVSLRYFNPSVHISRHWSRWNQFSNQTISSHTLQNFVGWRDKLTIFGGDYSPDGTCLRDYIRNGFILAHLQSAQISWQSRRR